MHILSSRASVDFQRELCEHLYGEQTLEGNQLVLVSLRYTLFLIKICRKFYVFKINLVGTYKNFQNSQMLNFKNIFGTIGTKANIKKLWRKF